MRILFLCTGNSCRSQMAEGLLRWQGGSVVEVASAGMDPRPVHPFAVRVMSEIGLDISRQTSKSVEPFLAERFDYVITLCEAAKEACPIFPGEARRLHWDLPDPAAAGGSEQERLEAFRRVRDQLAARIEELLGEILEEFLRRLAQETDHALPGALARETA
ncbi:MAG TPA: arsenate reductase ArsC [Terriglobia bacterium]|nr:arsenate reductase ArsC [Terriglobia bacterium]